MLRHVLEPVAAGADNEGVTRGREERAAAQAEVTRKLQQQGYEDEIGRLRGALAKLEAKYQRVMARKTQGGGEGVFHDPEFTELYGDTGIAKVSPVLSFVLDALRRPGLKLLLFAHHATVLWSTQPDAVASIASSAS